MSETFQAIVIDKTPEGQKVELRRLTDADLMDGDVTIAVEHSTVNYKDGLAITGKAPIIRRYPLVPGVDFSGTVITSAHEDFKKGDKVVLNGWSVGESHHGGYAGRARVSGDWLVPIPEEFSTADAMAIGTAGFTAMLAVLALEEQGVRPGEGDVLVTGAAGGVGSMAISLLSELGYRVTASTGRLSEDPYLKSIGAANVVDRNEFAVPAKPLGKMRWAGAIDSVGSTTLANILSQTSYGGTVAACGLAQGSDLPATVMPFILRGVRLVGIDSVHCPKARRLAAWERLARHLDKAKLAAMSAHVKLADVPRIAADIVQGKVRGRIVVDL
ncbi:MAG TPA: MDR family oxidoreductase [Aestuariivirgaceae bacterium]|nr:MDR family oxidoreductase [Aestuariivirgaceae bacterium]